MGKLLLLEVTNTFIASATLLLIVVIIGYYLSLINRSGVIRYRNFLEGTWRTQGVNPEDGTPWYFSYTFHKKEVRMEGSPHFFADGKYSIVGEEESLLKLEIVYKEGEAFYRKFENIGIDSKNNALLIGGRIYKKML